MLFNLPTLQELVSRIASAFYALLPGVDALVRPNNIEPTGKVFAGAMSELFGRLDYVAQQAFILYAEGEWLIAHGAEIGMSPLPASPATGPIDVTASDAISIPLGTQFTLSNGQAYLSTAAASLPAAGMVSVPVEAAAPGSDGNADAGAPATISAGSGGGITGPGASGLSAVVDAAGLTGGTDAEDTYAGGAFCQRILFRLQNPPAGGSAADYVRWAGAVTGVTRVFVERIWRGAGTVRVFPIFDNLFGPQGGVAPQNYIFSVIKALAPEQPADAIVTVVAPNPQIIDVTVSGLSPNNATTRNAIVAELQSAFQRLGRVSGGDQNIPSMPYLAYPFTFSLSWVQAAVINAAGVSIGEVTEPSADVAIAAGSIPVLGSVEFV